MRAVDTNVVVRFLIADDIEQSARARQVVSAGDLFVSTTVILETEWVLRSGYKLSPPFIVDLIRAFIGLPGVAAESTASLAMALGWAAKGMDLADAFHLAGARDCTAFVSFDRALARSAAGLSAMPVVEP